MIRRRSGRRPTLEPAVVLIAVVVGGCASFGELLQQGLESDDVACTADELYTTTSAAEPVRLRGWATDRGHGALSFEWSTSVGRIEGAGAEVDWHLAGAEPDTHRAVMMARDTTGTIGLCTVPVRLVVGFPTMLPAGVALLRGNTEAAGYALYSYLLLPVRPSAGTRARSMRALEFFGRVRSDVAPDPTRRDMALYVPLAADSVLPGQLADADWVLAHYDHDRAREILARTDARVRHDGPYLIVASVPLDDGRRRGMAMVSDLSGTPPDLMDAWIQHHLFMAAREGSWTVGLGRWGVLRLRTILNQLAEALPAIRDGLDEAVRLVRV